MSLSCFRVGTAVAESCRGWGRAGVALLAGLVCGCVLLFGFAPAAGAQTSFGSAGSGAGQLRNPKGVAVDQSTGDVWVVDTGNSRVDDFSSDGSFIEAFGWGVADGASQLETCTTTCQAGLSGSGAGEFSTPTGVAVDQSTGDVYVFDLGNLRVEKFDSSGKFILMFGGGVDQTTGANVCTAASGHVCGAGTVTPEPGGGVPPGEFGNANGGGLSAGSYIDVGSSGTVYVGDFGRIQEFSSSGNFTAQLATPSGPLGGGSVTALAVDPGGDVFERDSSQHGGVVELNPAGAQLQALDSQGSAQALAVDGAGDLFVFDSAGGNRFLEYDPSGDQVDSFPGGSVTGTGGGIGYADATRALYAVDHAGDDVQVISTVPPPGPFVSPGSERATGAGVDEANLNAIVNPNGQPTSYHFEYGTTGAYGQSTATGSLAGDSSFHRVIANLPGLAPGTTYHFRVVAGTTDGPDQTFTTAPGPVSQACPNVAFRSGDGASLPDCRAYEQVSPVDKNHADVAQALGLPDGTAALVSFNAFPGSVSSATWMGYGSTRSATGWETSALNPPLNTATSFEPLSKGGGFDPQTFELGASPGFGKVLVGTTAALAPGAVEGGGNLYVHDAASGSYQFVGGTPDDPGLGNPEESIFAGTNADGSKWVFSDQNFFGETPDSTPAAPADAAENLFEFSATGGLQLVGILPDGTVDPNGSAQAGPGFGSDFLAVGDHAVSSDASRVYWTEPTFFDPAPVYIREGGQTKVVSHDQTGAAQPATFWDATPDGSQALITSDTPLTANASAAGADLYRYDDGTGQLTDLTPDTADSGGAGVLGVFGSSDDGSFVYFLATGALAPGATAGADNMYVWHDGTTRFIGSLASNASEITGQFRDGASFQWQVSPDGRGFGLLFSGAIGGPHPQSAQPFNQAYYYSFDSDSLACASCLPNGGTPTGAASFHSSLGNTVLPSMLGAALFVTDGGRMFFNSPDALVPADTDGTQDAYEYELDGSGSCHSTVQNGGCVSLISTGHTTADATVGVPVPARVAATVVGASTNGDDVFFTTYDQLVGQDQDNNQDLYDARVDGGLASQNPPPPAVPCQGDACKGAMSSGPASAPVASVAFSGPGDLSPGASTSAKARVLTKAVRGTSFMVAVRAPAKGTITISGPAVTKARRSVAKAGAYRLRVTLTTPEKRLLRSRHKLSVKLRVAFAPAVGKPQAATVKLAVTPARAPHARHTRPATTKRGGAR